MNRQFNCKQHKQLIKTKQISYGSKIIYIVTTKSEGDLKKIRRPDSVCHLSITKIKKDKKRELKRNQKDGFFASHY